MSKRTDIALMAIQTLPAAPEGSEAPEWVHLLPAPGSVETFDGRGPYRYADADALISASMSRKARLVIDENHSTDIAAKMGLEAPARGYIAEMQARESGIWARIDWTGSGRALMADRAYWGLSPVVQHDKSGRISAILRATLTNDPNLRGLTALHAEEEADAMLLEKLVEMLGLDEGATEDDVLAALKAKMKTGEDGDAVAMQAQIGQIGTALGLDAEASPLAILTAAKAARAAGSEQGEAFVALQAQVKALTEGNTRRDAEAFVDQAIREKRVGVASERESFIALHMESPERAAKIVGGLPRLDRTGTTIEPPAPKDGEISLNAEQAAVAAMLGQSATDYAATLKAERGEEAL